MRHRETPPTSISSYRSTATQRLKPACSPEGWEKTNDMVFPNSRLGLIGGAWAKPGVEEKDIRTSGQDWLKEAFAAPVVLRKDGKRVIPRDYLVLMKMDSARGHDTGDLTRILGRMDDFEVEKTISVVSRYLDDEAS